MNFKKIHIKQITTSDNGTYRINISPFGKEYVPHFTDEPGFETAKQLEQQLLTFDQLPKPLLKQIK